MHAFHRISAPTKIRQRIGNGHRHLLIHVFAYLLDERFHKLDDAGHVSPDLNAAHALHAADSQHLHSSHRLRWTIICTPTVISYTKQESPSIRTSSNASSWRHASTCGDELVLDCRHNHGTHRESVKSGYDVNRKTPRCVEHGMRRHVWQNAAQLLKHAIFSLH